MVFWPFEYFIEYYFGHPENILKHLSLDTLGIFVGTFKLSIARKMASDRQQVVRPCSPCSRYFDIYIIFVEPLEKLPNGSKKKYIKL